MTVLVTNKQPLFRKVGKHRYCRQSVECGWSQFVQYRVVVSKALKQAAYLTLNASFLLTENYSHAECWLA